MMILFLGNRLNNIATIGLTAENCLKINEEINIGDWCLLINKEQLPIGIVLSFSYLQGTTQRSREFSRSFASIKPPVSDKNLRELGFLCTCFRYDEVGTLYEEFQNSSYLSLSSYKATIFTPTYENGALVKSKNLLKKITDFHANLQGRLRRFLVTFSNFQLTQGAIT